MKESGAEAVKLEGGAQSVGLVKRVLDAEVPVMGHIGLTPQSLHKMGGYKVQGKDFSGIERLMKDAVALDKAGVFSIVLEGVPREVAAMITREISAPTIGIGAGPDCDGQVLVFHDILNLTFAEPAKFVRRYADAAALITSAVQQFKADVETGSYPSDAESYHLPKETRAELEAILRRRESRRTRGSSQHVPEIPSAARDPYFPAELFGEMRHFFALPLHCSPYPWRDS